MLPTLKRVAPFEFGKDATAIAVEMGYDRFPRVARASQRWAGGCNPFRDCRLSAARSFRSQHYQESRCISVRFLPKKHSTECGSRPTMSATRTDSYGRTNRSTKDDASGRRNV